MPKVNIFFLDMNPKLAASYVHDVHVISAINETTQLLSVWADWYSGPHSEEIKNLPWTELSHQNNPCSLWLKETLGNSDWLAQYLAGLIEEYERRWNKKTNFDRAREISSKLNAWFRHHWVMTFYTIPAEVMPDEFRSKRSNKTMVVEAYRNYYTKVKLPGNKYTAPATIPVWALPPVETKQIKVPGLSAKGIVINKRPEGSAKGIKVPCLKTNRQQ